MERSEETQKNWLKRFKRKVAEGRIGKFVSWFDFMKEKPEIDIKDFDEYLGNGIGRISNRIYIWDEDGKFVLYRKFKNATKAKRFMEGVK